MPTYPPGATVSGTVYPWGKKYEITIPAWNDIIHITVPPTWTREERQQMTDADYYTRILGLTLDEASARSGRTVEQIQDSLSQKEEYDIYRLRAVETAIAMSRSPAPEIAQNLGTIMTALDDIQDFTTTVGVITRVLGRVSPAMNKIAYASFTVGELLNQLSLMNKLTGGEKAVICRLVRDLKKMSTKTTIKADVAKRMKRLFPSKGEALEILQTTDSLFGVGVSLGPIVGVIQDVFWGAATGAETRFKTWTMSDAEKKAILNAVYRVIGPTESLTDYETRMLAEYESSSLALAAGNFLSWADYAKALALQAESGLKIRGSRLKGAFIEIWETISGNKAAPKKKTSTDTRLLLESLGINPYGQDAWPVIGLGADATMQELMDAMSTQAQDAMLYWRNNLGASDDGLFLDACVQDAGLHAADMFTFDGGEITTSITTEPLIFIHALEAGLNPPPDTSLEKFTEWMQHIKTDMEYYEWASPPVSLLQSAYDASFPSP